MTAWSHPETLWAGKLSQGQSAGKRPGILTPGTLPGPLTLGCYSVLVLTCQRAREASSCVPSPLPLHGVTSLSAKPSNSPMSP